MTSPSTTLIAIHATVYGRLRRIRITDRKPVTIGHCSRPHITAILQAKVRRPDPCDPTCIEFYRAKTNAIALMQPQSPDLPISHAPKFKNRRSTAYTVWH